MLDVKYQTIALISETLVSKQLPNLILSGYVESHRLFTSCVFFQIVFCVI